MKTTHQILLNDDYIAESQRLGIAQNTTLRLMHQTWGLLWLARLILLATGLFFCFLSDALVFPTLFCGIMIAISFIGQYIPRRNLANARGQFRAKDTTTTVSMDPNGFDMLCAFGNSHTQWIAVLKPVIYPNGVLVKFSRFSMLWQVRQLLPENVKKAAT